MHISQSNPEMFRNGIGRLGCVGGLRGVQGPPVDWRDDHADAGDRDQVTALGKPVVCTRGRLAGYPESLGELAPARRRTAWSPLARSDLRLDRPRDLQVSRHSREVIKIIRHRVNLADQVEQADYQSGPGGLGGLVLAIQTC